MSRSLLVAAFVAGLYFAPAGARAQTTSAAVPLAESLHGEAKQAYESAKLLAQNNDFSGALEEFTHSYRLSKDARLLYNMAICHKGLHHYARMKAALEQYLAEGGASITPESRALAQDALAAARSLVATIRLSTNESGAEVLLDGQSVGTTPLAGGGVPVDIGSHRVTVRKQGFTAAEQSFEAFGGSDMPLALTLTPVQHAAARLVVGADAAATIVIDGSVLGRGHFDGKLEPGPHHVNVSEPGKEPYRADVELRDGETRQIEVPLESEKRGGSPWPWIAGGVAVAAGLAVGGYFLFKPEQTPTTPVPAGSFGSVHFAWGR